MVNSESPSVRWLDFSGAPPMLIPRVLAASWRGTTDPATGEYRELDTDNPVTDYDRAFMAAWPGRSTIEFMGSKILILYTEHDLHAWDSKRHILACGGWLPSDADLCEAKWETAIRWRAEHADYFLMNSAADATKNLRDEDFTPVRLDSGIYTIEYCDMELEYVGCFHRFVRDGDAG